MNTNKLSVEHCSKVTESVWENLKEEAVELSSIEPLLANFYHACILNHNEFSAALSFILSTKLSDSVMPAITLYDLFFTAYHEMPEMICSAANDVSAIIDRDPAASTYMVPVLYFKGFHAIQIHRVAHYLWHHQHKNLSLYIQSRNSTVCGVDIHPAAKIGQGVMFDHATGIVVGETAIIEDNVSILQGVTLGGTGKQCGERHPKVRQNVMIGSGAKILGNIEIGEGAKVGAGSVVLKDVMPRTTVAGVPAVKVGSPKSKAPCNEMNQNILEDADLSLLHQKRSEN